MKPVLINAGNLKHGGAVQVAASLLEEFAMVPGRPRILDTWVSPQVRDNLSTRALDILAPTVVDPRPIAQVRRSLRGPRHQVEFCVFGPTYGRGNGNIRLAGCADVTSFYPTPWARPSFGMRVTGGVRRSLSRWTFARYDHLVVESSDLARQLGSILRRPPHSSVISNAHHGIFEEPALWDDLPNKGELPATGVRLLYVSKWYPHKNIAFAASVAAEMTELGVPTVLFVTLSDAEWSMLGSELQHHCYNLGSLRIQEVPNAYKVCDAVIFPSLLEAFSATPLEALKMQRPLFASDREFVREVCGDVPVYIDPEGSPRLVANTIITSLSQDDDVKRRVLNGIQVLKARPTAVDRAERVLSLIDSYLGGTQAGSSDPN